MENLYVEHVQISSERERTRHLLSLDPTLGESCRIDL